MAVYEITDPDSGVTLEIEGDTPPNEQELVDIFSSYSQPQQVAAAPVASGAPVANDNAVAPVAGQVESLPVEEQGDYFGSGVIEPALAIASGAGLDAASGIAGIAQSLNPFAEDGAGAQAVEDVQSLGFTPSTPSGKENLQTIGDLVQSGADIINYPISGLAGLTELITGQGLDQAVKTIKSTQDNGIGKTAGGRVLEETGSPLAASIAETIPTAVATLTGTKGIQSAGRTAEVASNAVRSGLEVGAEAANTVGNAAAKVGDEIFNYQTPFKKAVAEKINAGSTDAEVAKFRLSDSGKAVKDKVATETINQGFDEGVIAAVKNATEADKASMLKMVDVMEKGKKNKLYAAQNRPSDVAGDTLMQRFKSVRDANKKAGNELGAVAQSLKGQNVDINNASINFSNSLDELGVDLERLDNGKFKPIFTESILSPGDRGPISEVIRQMNIRGTGDIDAFDVHKMKRIIDNNVTFGKTNKGISGDAERALKSFRRDLDSALDSNFPEYDRVNSVYAETIGAIDAFQDVAGRKMNLTGENADKATGTLLRRVMSNAQSRVRLLDAIDQIESVATKHGDSGAPQLSGASAGKNDLLTQVLFVDELDSVFGPVARTSLQGQLDQAIKQGANAATTTGGAADLAINAVGKTAEKVRGINEEGAFKSIKELLKQGAE